jgi:hypothetical protein
MVVSKSLRAWWLPLRRSYRQRANAWAGKNRASTEEPRRKHKPARIGVVFVTTGRVCERFGGEIVFAQVGGREGRSTKDKG